jgi:hypothetical protein
MGAQCPRHALDPLVIEENFRQMGRGSALICKTDMAAFPRYALLAPLAAT